jgi:LmbE family N-acetylglucosaminyl deacetylase
MSRTFRSGKRSATILFTDGEAGLDRFPRRIVDDSYPNHSLRGNELAEVRVREAARAMGILGSEAYVRLGLQNRPYNTLRDVVPLESVLEGWGGERALVAQLVELIRGYRPEVVVSPDGPSDAHEHFEHEAVGYLVRRALAELERAGDNPVKAHLVSIDPFQKQKYDTFVAVEGNTRDPQSGTSDRALQALALQQHVTQADASVIGLKRLPSLPSEYYQVKRWNIDRSLEEWLQ